MNGEFHIFADQPPQELFYVSDDGIGVDDARLDELLTAKRQKLLGEFRGAARGVLDGFGAPVNGRVTAKFGLKQFGLSQDHAEQVIEIVRDAAGQPADGVHFLGLQELPFERSPFGDVFCEDFEISEFACWTLNRPA
jgi:hypothetical protein